MPGACENAPNNIEHNNASLLDRSQLEATNDASTCSKGETKSSFLLEDGDSEQHDEPQASPSYLGKRKLSDCGHHDNSISNDIFSPSFVKSNRFSDDSGDLPVSSMAMEETSGAVLVLQAMSDSDGGCSIKIEGDISQVDGELCNDKTQFLEFMKDVDRLEPEQFLSESHIKEDSDSLNVHVDVDNPDMSTSQIYIALDAETSGLEPGQQYTIVAMQTLQPDEDKEKHLTILKEHGSNSPCSLTHSESQESDVNTSVGEKYEDSISQNQSAGEQMVNPQMFSGHYPRPYCSTPMQDSMQRYPPQMDTPRYAPLHAWNGFRGHVPTPHPQSMYMPSHQHPIPPYAYGRGMRQNVHFPSPYQPGYPPHQQPFHSCPSVPLRANISNSSEEHLENIPPETPTMQSNNQNLPMVDTFLNRSTIGPLEKSSNYYSVPYQGRENHNEKERKRRGRIKNSCQLMRELVPGLGEKTDKATVFEFCVQYLLHLKRIVGGKYDKEFVEKYNPY